MVEQGGSQLKQVLPNTNPWAGGKDPQGDCHTCTQGGGQDRKEDWFRRNIMYEARCGVCEDKVEKEADEKGGKSKKKERPKFGEKYKEENVYVGETSRTLYERCKEHIKAGRYKKEDSFIAKHWEEKHPEKKEMPEFRFKIASATETHCPGRLVKVSV